MPEALSLYRRLSSPFAERALPVAAYPDILPPEVEVSAEAIAEPTAEELAPE